MMADVAATFPFLMVVQHSVTLMVHIHAAHLMNIVVLQTLIALATIVLITEKHQQLRNGVMTADVEPTFPFLMVVQHSVTLMVYIHAVLLMLGVVLQTITALAPIVPITEKQQLRHGVRTADVAPTIPLLMVVQHSVTLMVYIHAVHLMNGVVLQTITALVGVASITEKQQLRNGVMTADVAPTIPLLMVLQDSVTLMVHIHAVLLMIGVVLQTITALALIVPITESRYHHHHLLLQQQKHHLLQQKHQLQRQKNHLLWHVNSRQLWSMLL